jgi:hypothetical protein
MYVLDLIAPIHPDFFAPLRREALQGQHETALGHWLLHGPWWLRLHFGFHLYLVLFLIFYQVHGVRHCVDLGFIAQADGQELGFHVLLELFDVAFQLGAVEAFVLLWDFFLGLGLLVFVADGVTGDVVIADLINVHILDIFHEVRLVAWLVICHLGRLIVDQHQSFVATEVNFFFLFYADVCLKTFSEVDALAILGSGLLLFLRIS